ncbi:putative reverse transcriptase domain-containing protein [Tanacetum coccineum]
MVSPVASSSQQQDKGHKVIRAHTAGPGNKNGDAGNLPLLVIKLEIIGPSPESEAEEDSSVVIKTKAEVTCYECGRLGHYKNGCLERKNLEPSEQEMERKNLWRL